MTAAQLPLVLQVGLNSWIIADGNYDSFRVGETRSFALEYYHEADLRSIPKSRATRGFAPLGGARYSITRRTLHIGRDWAAIDVGLPVYRELYSLPPPPKRFEGVIGLSVDPFFYFKRHAHEHGAPPLIFDWRINRIEVETAPRILRGGLWIYDPARLRLKAVEDTRDGEDFLLHCELVSDQPRHSLAPR